MDDQTLADVITWVPGSIAFFLPAIPLMSRRCRLQPRVALKPVRCVTRGPERRRRNALDDDANVPGSESCRLPLQRS
jgi:hypothetical protein